MIKTPERYSRKLSEKDKFDVGNLNRRYYSYYLALNECVEKGYITDGKALEIINSLEEKRKAEIFFIPRLNKIVSQSEKMISKSLEKIFGRAFE